MPIIAISRGSYSHGKRVAEKVAEKLGYECVSREALLRASNRYTSRQIDVFRAAGDGPSVLDRIAYGKERYVAYIRKALLDRLSKDNVVYHGFAGHFFLQGVSHVLKVRIVANLDQRVAEEMRRKGIPSAQAREGLEKDDDAHRRWSRYMYGIDPADSHLYDLIVPMHSKTADEAAEIIAQAAGRSCFKVTPESRNALRMLHLAAQVQASLVDDSPFAKVGIEESDIVVTTRGRWTDGQKMMSRVGRIIEYERASVGIKVRLTKR
jgi:cytidylate kinase